MGEELLLPCPFSDLAGAAPYVSLEPPARPEGDFERWSYTVFAREGTLTASLTGQYCVRSSLAPSEKRAILAEVAASAWNSRTPVPLP